MTVRKQGFYWHVHHDKLIERCYNHEERARYIQTDKPKNEQEIRLRLFQPVKGNLPNEVIKAGQAYDEAYQVYDKAGQAYGRARQVCDEASQAYYKALLDNMPAIKELHAVECTNCPWDGHTIFPNT